MLTSIRDVPYIVKSEVLRASVADRLGLWQPLMYRAAYEATNRATIDATTELTRSYLAAL